MNKFLSPILVLALLAVVAVPTRGQAGPPESQLSLKECIDLVLRNSPSLEMAAEAVTGAEKKVDESRSQVFPQVSLAGSYTRMTLVQEFEIAFGGQTFKAQFGVPNNYDFRASAAEQLFTWGRVGKSIALSRTGVELARGGLDQAKQILSYQVAPIFYGIIFLREAINVLDDNIRLFEQKLGIMTRRYQAGLASSFDTSTLEVQISTLKAQRLDFENNIRKLNIAFNTLAGRSADSILSPQGAITLVPQTGTPDVLVAKALSQRIEFEQLGRQAQMAQLGIDVARAASKPSLVLALNYDFRNGYLPNINRIVGNFMATLSVNYPIFDGFRTRALVAEGESSLRSIDWQRRSLERSVKMEIDTSLADLKNFEDKIAVEEAKIQQAQDALRIAEDRYQNGLLSATDYVESQNNLNSARLNRLQLLYNHVLSTYNLYRAVGKRIYD
jgi:outer membrane protein